MNNKTFVRLIVCLGLIIMGCSKDNPVSKESTQISQGSVSSKAVSEAARGATQISGLGNFGVCDFVSQGASYAITLTGDLDGCHYFFIEEFECSPSGTYREEGRELFIGTYKGESGTFGTTYKFEGKYEGCNEDGSPIGAEILGRCQHPIVEGSGTGVFEGVTGRLDFKDDIEAGNFPYRGHFSYK